MTQLYTSDEILEDIHQHEGVDITIPEKYKRLRFLKLYSQIYPQPCKGIVDDLKKRVGDFISEKGVTVHAVDIEPDFSYKFNLYYSDFSMKQLATENNESLMKFLMKSNNFEEIDKVGETGISQMLISTEDEEVYYVEARRH